MFDELGRVVLRHVVEPLKRRAAQHRRSLQQEMLTVLDHAAIEPVDMSPVEIAAAIRARLAEDGVAFEDSAPLIHSDRNR